MCCSNLIHISSDYRSDYLSLSLSLSFSLSLFLFFSFFSLSLSLSFSFFFSLSLYLSLSLSLFFFSLSLSISLSLFLFFFLSLSLSLSPSPFNVLTFLHFISQHPASDASAQEPPRKRGTLHIIGQAISKLQQSLVESHCSILFPSPAPSSIS